MPLPPPGDLPNPGIKHESPVLQADSFTTEPPGKPHIWVTHSDTFVKKVHYFMVILYAVYQAVYLTVKNEALPAEMERFNVDSVFNFVPSIFKLSSPEED